MLNKTDDIPVSAPEAQTTEQSVIISTDMNTITNGDTSAETTTVSQTVEMTKVEQTYGIIAETVAIVNAATFAESTTASQKTEAASVAESANLEISFLPEDFPTLPDGMTKVDDTEHVRKIEWEKLAQDDVSALVKSIKRTKF